MNKRQINKPIPIIVIGAGGHAKVIIDCLQSTSINILGFTNISNSIKDILNIPYLGDDSYIEKYNPQEILLALGIGSIKSCKIRKHIFEKWKAKGFNFITVIHPSANISKSVTIGEGSQILMGVNIQTGVEIKSNCIINTSCSIDHDCIINSHSNLAPRTVLSGNVHIGSEVYIGVGATIIQNIKIESNSVVGAGAVVIRDVPSNNLALGLPAKNKNFIIET